MKKLITVSLLILITITSCFAMNQEVIVNIDGTDVVLLDGYVVEPDSYLNIESMSIADFGSYFEEAFDVSVSSYKLMTDTIAETTVYHIHSNNPGPVVYIAAGTHGNERAGWYAGILMRSATISCGDLYVLAPVNANGARNLTRYVQGNKDPNRSYPGSINGDITDRLCYAVYNDIADKNPEIVLDLHEAITYKPQETDFLGSTYIFTELDGMDDLFWDMLWATEDGELCHNEFGIAAPGPIGSLNATVTRSLGIPTITIETFRGYDIIRRVQDQLASVEYVLDYKGMR